MKRIFLATMVAVIVLLGVVSSGCVRPHFVLSGKFAGYEVSSYDYVIKIINGLLHTVKIRYGGREIELKPGGETPLVVSKFYSSRDIVITAVVFDRGEITGTAVEEVRVPSHEGYDDDRSQMVWHITSYDKLRD